MQMKHHSERAVSSDEWRGHWSKRSRHLGMTVGGILSQLSERGSFTDAHEAIFFRSEEVYAVWNTTTGETLDTYVPQRCCFHAIRVLKVINLDEQIFR